MRVQSHSPARPSRVVTLLAVLALLLFAATAGAAKQAKHKRENPDILWHFIHDHCAPAGAKGIYPPAPCTEVVDAHDPSRGYVVFKDRDGRYQYLVLPLERITGIESPKLLVPDAPNYLAAAWSARMYVEAALHKPVPRETIGLVVNSAHGRSQNQLHIHVDCIQPHVHAVLQRLVTDIRHQWHALPERLPDRNGQRYMVRWVEGAQLSLNPFRDLARALPPGDSMSLHSLVVVGARDAKGRPGFILLSTRANAITGNEGNSDNLQDMSCALATSSTP